jgi:hypothetical protein
MRSRFGSVVAGLIMAACLPAVAAAAVQVSAHVSRTSLTIGESVSMQVVVEGAIGSVADPEFNLPDGVEILGSAQSRNVSWVNGRMSSTVTYRYEIGANAAGTFSLGPIRVKVGGQIYQSPAITLSVSAASAQISGSGSGPVSLTVEVSPSQPYVGQPVVLRVRLIQRAQLAEDPQGYEPPPTPGFWSERSSQPESYAADEAHARVLVTETRTRLYPLAVGETTVGSAAAIVRVATPVDRMDPFAWLGGAGQRRDVELRSRPVTIRVRALPPGGPAGFDGAVGRLAVSWSADRASSAQDGAFTLRLDVRGVGNLPLLRTPELRLADGEVFMGAVEDSFGASGSLEPGRRRFQWTVLAKRTGALTFAAPAFSWFDPQAGAYRTASPPPVTVDIGPPALERSDSSGAFPPAFSRHMIDPFGRPARPWGLAVAGALLGLGVRAGRGVRRSRRAAEHAASPTWLEGLRHAHGPSFWSAAERGYSDLAARGENVRDLRTRVEAARYGGAALLEEPVREELLRRLTRAEPQARSVAARVVIAAVAVLAAVAVGLWSAPAGGGASGEQRMLAADRAARAGNVPAAARGWRSLWREGARHPGLAARLAWAEILNGGTAEATGWVLRGDRGERRDPALAWVMGQIRDAGGLVGFTPSRLPVRTSEWAGAAFLAALLVGWVGRRASAVALAASLALASADGIQKAMAARVQRGVVRTPATLQGASVELMPGQIVRVVERGQGRWRVEAGRDASGWLDASALAVEDGS